MQFLSAVLIVSFLSSGLAGCNKAAVPSAGSSRAEGSEGEIRTAILAHLAHRGTLNLQAFDTEVTQVAFQGDRAQARVDFRVKNGPGTMQLTYQLEKRNGSWAVTESNPVASNFSHPALGSSSASPDAAPSGVPDSIKESLKDFNAGKFGGSFTRLPAGHPSSAGDSGSSHYKLLHNPP
jgi:hypothetical protein